MATRPAREVWETALGSLQLEVNRHNFDTWLKNTVGLELADSHLTVGVPSSFVADCLEKRLSPVIRRTLSNILKADVEVRYQVHHPRAHDNGTPLDRPVSPSAAPQGKGRQRAMGKGLPLNPRYTFETFVVGQSNRFAHAAAMAVSENPGLSYNPLFIHAGVGLGKTHLLHAIGHAIAAKGYEHLYVSAEQFTNDFVGALREGRSDEFREKYRTTDVLLIDDIQFIAGKEHSKEGFFHTFNDLHASNKQIVITSDARPKSIPLVEERLISRFEGGLLADIQPPELETRLAILDLKAAHAGLVLGKDVADFIARKVLRNVRELEGALNRLVAMSRLTNRAIDMELAHQAIAELPSAPRRRRHFTPQAIISTVATFYEITPEVLASPSRKKEIALARQVAAYLLREETERSLADVGKLLGERGHSTMLRAHDKIAYEINVNPELRHQIAEIRATLEHRHAESA